MRKELEHFYIGEALGGSQEWFLDPYMKLGGCGAVTACDTCIWLARSQGADWLYPFEAENICRQDFLHFGRIMKPYLRPRSGGINRLELYMKGFQAYLRGRLQVRQQKMNHESQETLRMLQMEGFPGTRTAEEGWEAVVHQIDEGFPIPMLMLRHHDPELKDLVWHWFLLIGYDQEDGSRKVKVVTYGEWAWLDFDRLWDTGHEKKGGLVLYRWE